MASTNKRVSFQSTAQCRNYERILVQAWKQVDRERRTFLVEMPLAIGWRHTKTKEVPLQVYTKKSLKATKTSPAKRFDSLLQFDFTYAEIKRGTSDAKELLEEQLVRPFLNEAPTAADSRAVPSSEGRGLKRRSSYRQLLQKAISFKNKRVDTPEDQPPIRRGLQRAMSFTNRGRTPSPARPGRIGLQRALSFNKKRNSLPETLGTYDERRPTTLSLNDRRSSDPIRAPIGGKRPPKPSPNFHLRQKSKEKKANLPAMQ